MYDITVVSQDENVLNAIEELKDIIKDQSNTKDVLCASEFEKLSFNAKPNLKILGPISEGKIITIYMRDIDIENTRKLESIDNIKIFETPDEILDKI